jgi:CRP-like cAMP-binding protein
MAAEDRARLKPVLEPVDLPFGTRLLAPGQTIEHVHFIEAGLGSDLAMAGADERPVECGLVGRDGLIGMPALLRRERAVHAAEMQVGGHGLRLAREHLWEAMDASASLRNHLLSYAHVFVTQTAQSAACNARHGLTERLARWVLMAHDRLSGNDVPLTHEYLSLMLGVRRAGVTQALHVLEGERLIASVRGIVTVTDREGLEAASCPCYGIVRREFERVFGRHFESGTTG